MNSASTKPAPKIRRSKTGWRRHKLIIQFLEYMVGGGVYFWGGMAVFAICFDGLRWPWWISKGLADIFGWSANFAIQRYWAFYDPRLKGQDRRVIFRFVLVNGIDLIFDYLIVWGFVHNGITPYAGFFASAAFTTVWDYLWYRFWVFRPLN
ncbi:MAG TPA: GtrA family protein [Candidatus Saccharimonadales bacterium]|nr:GtrA family protein [Candidatus Saccharimonadales bacterium]